MGGTRRNTPSHLECNLQVHGKAGRQVVDFQVDSTVEWVAVIGLILLVPALIWAWLR